MIWVLAMSSGFAATFTLPMPRARRVRPPTGWASRAGHLPRYQGPAVRHGAWRHAHRRTNPARPTAAHQRVRNGAAHNARRRLRKPRDGPIAQVQHVEDPHPFVVQARLHALRTDPNHARSKTIPAYGPLRRDRIKMPFVQRTFRGHLK